MVEYPVKCWRCKHLQHIILPQGALFICRKTKKEIAQYDKDSDELKYFCEYEPCGFGYFEEVDYDDR